MRNLVASPVNIHELALQVLPFCKCNAVNQEINLSKLVLHFLEKGVKQFVADNIALRINRIMELFKQWNAPLLCPCLIGSTYPAASLVKPLCNMPCYALVICNAEDYCLFAFQVDCDRHFIAPPIK